MAEDFGIELVGERAAVLRFTAFPTFAHDRLLATMQSLEVRLEAAVRAAAPTKTGALRSLIGGRVYDHDTRIAAVVGVRTRTASDARKAAALEYGSRLDRAFRVRAHEMMLDHFWSRAVNRHQVTVPDHSRTGGIDAQRFLRTPLDSMRAEAKAEMQAAIQLAIKDASA